MTAELVSSLDIVALEDCSRSSKDLEHQRPERRRSERRRHDFAKVTFQVTFNYYGLAWHQAVVTERCAKCGALQIVTWKTDMAYAIA